MCAVPSSPVDAHGTRSAADDAGGVVRRAAMREILTPRALWRQRVAATPDRPFLVHDGQTRTFAEADDLVRRVANGLADLGVDVGTRVLLGLNNHADTVVVQRAVAELGGVLVPLVPGLSGPELAYQCRHSEGEVLIVEDPIASELRPHWNDLPRLRTLVGMGNAVPDAATTYEELLRSPATLRGPLPGYDDQSLWAILYTSGSTGQPKGVMLPAGSFVSGGGGYAERFGVRSDDNFVVPTTFAHAVGAANAQSVALHTGCRLTVLDRFSPRRWWQQVDEVGGTVAVLFPAQLNLLLEVDDGTPGRGETPFRLALTHAYNARFRDRFGVAIGLCWAMTETGAVSAGSDPGYHGEHGDGYVGRPWPSTEIAVFDAEGNRLGPGQVGEVALRHPHVMLGYLKNPEATAKTLVDGWIRSGDRGSLDEAGHLWFRGRIKNVIKRSGENIGAEEVEAALTAHPAVVEAAVFGVPDRLRTEEVGAVVVVPGDAALTARELTDAVAGRLARWKVPRYVLLRTVPLPRLPNEKIDMPAVRALFADGAPWDRTAGA